MIICTIPTSDCTPQTIVIGRRTTYDTLQVVFDLSYLTETYGNGAAVLVVKRSQDETAYPATVTQDGNTLTWTISEVDTYYVGAGECELMWYVNDGLAKTIIYPVVVMRDILQTTEPAPDAYENWVESLTALGAETLQNAQNAAQSASDAESAKDDAVTAKEAAETAQEAAETAVTHYPKIENNYWMVWDVNTQQYVSTGIQAEGEDGYSPEVTIESITGGHRVTITDEDHPQGQSFDVMDGQGGEGAVNDVQINGNSIVSGGVADIPLATSSSPGLSYPYSNRGLLINADGQISVTKASDNSIKAGSAQYAPIVPSNQHGAAFYGLAKAAGDATQAASDNPVGTYTDDAKAAIKDMIGATAGEIEFDDSETYPTGSIGAEVSAQKNAINQNEESVADTQSMIATVEATTTASKNYAVGDLLVYDGKLYKVTSAIATGATIIVGSNVTQTTVEDQLGSGGGSGGAVDDVQINGTSIVSDGVANVPVATTSTVGVVRAIPDMGTQMYYSAIYVNCANESDIKNGANWYKPIGPRYQHNAIFYGLAKAAGDSTQSSSSNPVGTYTDDAKAAIQTMLGVAGIVGTVEGSTASKAYAVGDAFLHAGSLYKATASIASGDAITPGTNCTQTTLISIIKGE